MIADPVNYAPASTSCSSNHGSNPVASPGCNVASPTELYMVFITGTFKGCKKFYFEDINNFKTSFQPWLDQTFGNPNFDWNSMEFYHDLENRREALELVDEAADELEIWFIRKGSRKVVLQLRLKEKNEERL
ncbi:hypothetical protein TWF694_005990 [Orbilia ellipsospora]|uniref:Uncharacterized protein n=1 Tax=Orbilia ellipsospora TaxID=2528407 RepID=A0AAV9WT08_9PEZI